MVGQIAVQSGFELEQQNQSLRCREIANCFEADGVDDDGTEVGQHRDRVFYYRVDPLVAPEKIPRDTDPGPSQPVDLQTSPIIERSGMVGATCGRVIGILTCYGR